MRILILLIVLFGAVLFLSGCGRYGMGMRHGGYWYGQSQLNPGRQLTAMGSDSHQIRVAYTR